jgi:predicted nucleotidyltransferase
MITLPGLAEQDRELIASVLRLYPEITRAVLFGSRAKGTHRPNSDIDIALFGPADDSLLARIKGKLDTLPMPYLLDIVIYNAISHEKLRQHIDLVGQEIYARQSLS